MIDKTQVLNTLEPYETLEHKGIQYTNCRNYPHISRYRGLRQVVHNPQDIEDRFIALESPNPFTSSAEVMYHQVTAHEENRLDLISTNTLGTPTYAWAIAYFNGISDGFTVKEGQRLAIPKSFTSLFNTGELLSPVSALTLNLGEE